MHPSALHRRVMIRRHAKKGCVCGAYLGLAYRPRIRQAKVKYGERAGGGCEGGREGGWVLRESSETGNMRLIYVPEGP